ncbi:PucR family transcriptional regulator ligand-binding domain-containing protein [Neobacillus pocheonensis]|uniref:PucR family transcriptional regulator n=1 Tax=Neobacillus pocheonensis TaxID=363869 RepID=UPI003D2D5CEC
MEILDLMKIPIFDGANMIAGKKGSHRTVHTVTMMDAPDIIDFVKPNELLVTTGYWFHENPDNLVLLIKEMERKGCAGLGIKTKRYLQEIPASVIQTADELAFPLIDIPLKNSLGDIVNQTLSFLLKKSPSELLNKLHIRRKKDHFFAGVLEGTYSSTEGVLVQGKSYGLVDAPFYLLVAGKPDGAAPLTDQRKEALCELFEMELGNQPNPDIFFTKEDLFIIICPIFTKSDDIEPGICEWLKKMQDLMDDTLQIPFSFGMGNYVECVTDLKRSYDEAKNELDMGYRLGKRKFIQLYRGQTVGELLRMIPTPNLQEFYEKTLGELAHPLEQDQIGLIDTLNLYLKNNCNIAETAKELFVHRNTVIYRIQKCEDLLGVNLKIPEVAFKLRIALLIHTLI